MIVVPRSYKLAQFWEDRNSSSLDGHQPPGEKGRSMRREHGRLPSPQLAEALRAGLPGLAEAIYAEINASIPDYTIVDFRPPAIPAVVNEALTVFVARIADPAVPMDRLIGLFRALGRKELNCGRSLDSLQTAVRIAFRTSWHRISEVCTR